MTRKALIFYTLVPILCAVLSSSLLTGCGGGGGSGGPPQATLTWGQSAWDVATWG